MTFPGRTTEQRKRAAAGLKSRSLGYQVHRYNSVPSVRSQWMGSASLPTINPGQSVPVSVPVIEYAPPFAMGRNTGVIHNFRFLIKGAPSYQGENQRASAPLQIAVTIPPAFCMQRPPQPPQQKPAGATAAPTVSPNVGEAYQTGGSGEAGRRGVTSSRPVFWRELESNSIHICGSGQYWIPPLPRSARLFRLQQDAWKMKSC